MSEQKIQRHELYDDGLEQHPQGTWVRYQDVEPILLAADAMAKAWSLMDSESSDNNPVPDLALRAEYRKRMRAAHAAYRKAVSK